VRRLICVTLIIAGLLLSCLHVAAGDQEYNEIIRDLNKKGVRHSIYTWISRKTIGSYLSEGKNLYIYIISLEVPTWTNRVAPFKGLYFFLYDYGKPSGSSVCLEEIGPLRDAVNRFVEIASQPGTDYYYHLTESRWLLLELINSGEPGDYYIKITTDTGHSYPIQDHNELKRISITHMNCWLVVISCIYYCGRNNLSVKEVILQKLWMNLC